ncbi:MAG: hypothetical protein Q8T11_15280 [Elusimicrobiota bacterium]|nr:hypothetical protein [Elusimicrobiota bacterium]
MAGTGSARGGLGWVILVIALAVPGVLFYNWWSGLKAEREKAVAAKARGRVPEGGVFQSSPNAKLVNPMAPAVSTAAAAEPAAGPADAAGVIPAAAAEPPAALPPPAPAVDAAPVASTESAAAFAASSTTILPLKRDPTLSPFDMVRLLEEEEARRKAAEDLANASKFRNRAPAKPKAVNPTSLVNLQGIVSNPDSGFKAIVNDEVLGVGDFIGDTKIRIIKITDLGVTFNYQGKKFTKGVSRD